MTPLYIPGGWYCSATKDAYAALRPVHGDIESSQGNIQLPGQNILYLDCAVINGQLCLAGSGHSSDGAFLWNGDWLKVYDGRPYGTSPCKFGPLGLYVSIEGTLENILVFDPLSGQVLHTITKAVGARGIAAVTGSGEYPDDVHSQDSWYGRDGFAEYLELGDGVRIGQGANGGLCAKDGDRPLITLEAGDNQFIRGHLDGSTITASAWQRDRARSVILHLERIEVQAMEPAPLVIPAINRSLWLGFFTGRPDSGSGWSTETLPTSLPGNCYLLIPDGLLLTKTRIAIGQWCAAPPGGTVEDVEAAAQLAATVGRRAVAYWDAWTWPRRPVLPVGSLCCQQAYCPATVPVPTFEMTLKGAVARTAGYGYDVALVAQCYTSNSNLTSDLASLVPVYARVARDLGPIQAMLVFSGSGRATGLQDHPTVRPLWNDLAASVMTPNLSPRPVPVLPPPPTRFPAALPLSGVTMKVYAKKDGKYIGCAPNSDRVYTDRLQGGGWEEIDLNKKGDRFIANLIAANRVLSIEPDGTLTTRSPGTDGPYEQLYATTQPDGSNLLYRLHDGVLLPVLQIEAA
jgi:hypothetical protein